MYKKLLLFVDIYLTVISKYGIIIISKLSMVYLYHLAYSHKKSANVKRRSG